MSKSFDSSLEEEFAEDLCRLFFFFPVFNSTIPRKTNSLLNGEVRKLDTFKGGI